MRERKRRDDEKERGGRNLTFLGRKENGRPCFDKNSREKGRENFRILFIKFLASIEEEKNQQIAERKEKFSIFCTTTFEDTLLLVKIFLCFAFTFPKAPNKEKCNFVLFL